MLVMSKDGVVLIHQPVDPFMKDPFLKSCCKKDPDERIRSRDLYEAYKAYCTAEDIAPLTINTFVKRLKKEGLAHMQVREGKSKVSYFLGLSLYETPDHHA